MHAMPLPAAPFAAIPGAEMLYEHPAGRYALAPPSMLDFHPADARRAREFLAIVTRPEAVCPAEAVVLFRDAIVIDGRYVLSRDGIAVAETYHNVHPGEALARRQQAELGRIAAGDVASLPDGPPVVALFMQDCNNFGHNVVEVLPRLQHLAAAGIRRFRLLFPQAASPFHAIVAHTLRVLELEAELVPVPDGAILRVPALHWVSLVGQGWTKSPTVLRLIGRLRAEAPPAAGPERLYVTRPARSRRPVANAGEIEDLARSFGYTVVEPSALPFADQIALFAGARRVAGPMGAGLTLIAAMAPETRVAMFESGNCDYFYWDLACMAGLDFTWAFTGPIGPFDLAKVDAPITIPPALARRAWHGLEA